MYSAMAAQVLRSIVSQTRIRYMTSPPPPPPPPNTCVYIIQSPDIELCVLYHASIYCECYSIHSHTHAQDITKKEKGGGGQDESGEEDGGHAVSIRFLFPFVPRTDPCNITHTCSLSPLCSFLIHLFMILLSNMDNRVHAFQ